MKKNWYKRRFSTKKKNIHKMLFIVVIAMTVGFAALNTTLQLIGTLNISRTTWNIHWANPTKTGGVTATKDASLKTGDNTTVEYQVTLANQGDFYEFTVDAQNEGTIDAMITGIDNKVYENNVEVQKPDYLDFTVTYGDNNTIANNHLLAAGKSETYKVKVQYKNNLTADQLPTSTRNLKFTFQVTYMQSDEDSATTTCGTSVSFADDSWELIACNVRKGNIYKYHIGDTKTIEMDINNDSTPETYTLRIVNFSNPSECKNNNFSQTACDFVVEFSQIITSHRMNPYDQIGTVIGDGNYGGWEYSEMRSYLNNELYNLLPSDLKNQIIDTRVISSHGSNDSTNFTTTDKLYLLSTHEVWEDSDGDQSTGIDFNDTAYNNTRQLDFYQRKGTRTAGYTYLPIKEDLTGTNYGWWLRTARTNDENTDHNTFMYASYEGYSFYNASNYPGGVSPAFRIG